ncbi:MAG: glycosyltransferase [Dolichospermum sp.]
MNKNKNKFHLWFPNIFEFTGGIQTYCCFFLQAIQNIYPDTDYDIFIKHDRHSSPNFSTLAPTRFHFAGSIPLPLRTVAFAAQLIGWGIWKRPNLIITGHLNFTVAAWNIKNPALQTALHHADLILAVSSYTRDRLIKEQNLDPHKVVILPNTFDFNRFQLAPKPAYLLEKYGLRREQPIVLTVARLAEVEGYNSRS